MASTTTPSLASFLAPTGRGQGTGDPAPRDAPAPQAVATTTIQTPAPEGSPAATFTMPADAFMASLASAIQRASFLMDAVKIQVPEGDGPVTFAAMDSSHVCMMNAELNMGTRSSKAFDITLRCADVLKIITAIKGSKPKTISGSFSPGGLSLGGFTVKARDDETLDPKEESFVQTFQHEIRSRLTASATVLVDSAVQQVKNALVVDDIVYLHVTAAGVSIEADDDGSRYAHAITLADGTPRVETPATGCFSARFVENAVKPGSFFPKVKALAGRGITIELATGCPLLITERLPWVSGEVRFLVAPRVEDDDEDEDGDEITTAMATLEADEDDDDVIDHAYLADEPTAGVADQ